MSHKPVLTALEGSFERSGCNFCARGHDNYRRAGFVEPAALFTDRRNIIMGNWLLMPVSFPIWNTRMQPQRPSASAQPVLKP